MRTLICLLALTTVASAQEIDDFDFNWTVAQQGDDALVVHRDEDRTEIQIRGDIRSVAIKTADAVAVGKLLATVEDRRKALQGTGKSEDHQVGDTRVSFNDGDSGFYVAISQKRGFTSLILDRKSCTAFAPHLQRAEQLVKRVESIKF